MSGTPELDWDGGIIRDEGGRMKDENLGIGYCKKR